jgi:hypothetical protein
MPTPVQKFRFLKRVYFGTSDNPVDDVNPFSDLQTFGSATIGEMSWGIDSEVRKRSKIRFSQNYFNVLRQFGIRLEIEEIFLRLVDEKSNDTVVMEWAEIAEFQ